MLDFFYRKGYIWHNLPESDPEDRPSNALELHARMCNLGQKYLCEDLQNYAREAFARNHKAAEIAT